MIEEGSAIESIDEIRVSIDGYINFPLIGKVEVNGLSTSELETRIEELLGQGSCVNACDGLLDTALSRECADNVTVIVVEFNEIGQEA